MNNFPNRPPQKPPQRDPRNPNDPRKPDGSPQGGNRFQIPPWAIMLLLLLFAGYMMFNFSSILSNASGGGQAEVPYSFLKEQISAGNVKNIYFSAQQVRGEFKATTRFTPSPTGQQTQAVSLDVNRFTSFLPPVQDDSLIPLLEDNNVEIISTDPSPSGFWVLLIQLGPLLLIGAFLFWSFSRARQQQGNIFGFGQTRARRYAEEHPQVTFADVAGEDAAKAELTEMVDFLKDPDKYLRLGARIPRGVLLVGPPGTGKTLLARAVAGEAKVPFFSLSASEFVEMFVGVGASRVRDLFTRAKAAAPCIIFIDEIDAVGRQRGAGLGGGNDEREQTLNQLLVEMDGFDQRETVIVMAATNRPDVLDPALLRPGRFDRQVTVGLPDRIGRTEILKVHTRHMPLAQEVDLNKVGQATIGFSGADLENLANEAALSAARNRRDKLTMRDFEHSLDRIILGTERPPLSDPHERKVVAYHEAGHALVGVHMPEADPVLKVGIVPRGRALGVTQTMPLDDKRNYSKEYLFARLVVLFGGRSAEEIAIGQITSGAENDLRVATRLARDMVAQLGMSDELGPLNYGDSDQQPFLGYSLAQNRMYSEETAAKIDEQTKRLLVEAQNRARQILNEHKDQLDAMAKALLEEEIIDQARVLAIAGKTPEPMNDR